jgi:hypothetical protein
MIIIKTKKLWVTGLAFYPFIFLKPKNPSATLINHERIHLRQQLEMGLLVFYVWYFTEYFFLWIKYRSKFKAYRNISFEKEAFENEKNLDYLLTRKLWSFWKYF